MSSPSRFVITQAALLAISNLERNKQILPGQTKYEEYARSHRCEDVRVAAVKAMANMSPHMGVYLLVLLNVIEREHVPGVKLRMVESWAAMYKSMEYQRKYAQQQEQAHVPAYPQMSAPPKGLHVHTRSGRGPKVEGLAAEPKQRPAPAKKPLLQPVDLGTLRKTESPEDEARSRKLMEGLWTLLTKKRHYELRWAIYQVYESIWGKSVPQCASDQQRFLNGKIPKERVGNARRKAKAAEELQRMKSSNKRPLDVHRKSQGGEGSGKKRRVRSPAYP